MSITKYLANYAEPEVESFSAELSDLDSLSQVDSIAVLPAFDETLKTFDSLLKQDHEHANPLCVVVVNSPEQADEGSIGRTCALRDQLITTYMLRPLGDQFWFSKGSSAAPNSILLIDRCRQDRLIPRKQGVGLARKIGMDVALYICHQLMLNYGKEVGWIHSLDADVTLPSDYFSCLKNIAPLNKNLAAAIYPFEHRPVPGAELGLAFYELTLRYYEDRLLWAGSPYGFQTVGSTIACRPESYATVRGMPKRSGAEDFYFLNKLAKSGEIMKLTDPVLSISGRVSERVPFGTGPAIARIQKLGKVVVEEYRYYHPRIFVVLKAFIEGMLGLHAETINRVELRSQLIEQLEEREVDALCELVQVLKIDEFFAHVQGKTIKAAAYRKQFEIWFDGFQTLKFVHGIRDRLYPNVGVSELEGLLDGQFEISTLVRQRIAQLKKLLSATNK